MFRPSLSLFFNSEKPPETRDKYWIMPFWDKISIFNSKAMLRKSIVSLRRSIVSLRKSIVSLRRSIASLRRSLVNLRRSDVNLRNSKDNLRKSIVMLRKRKWLCFYCGIVLYIGRSKLKIWETWQKKRERFLLYCKECSRNFFIKEMRTRSYLIKFFRLQNSL